MNTHAQSIGKSTHLYHHQWDPSIECSSTYALQQHYRNVMEKILKYDRKCQYNTNVMERKVVIYIELSFTVLWLRLIYIFPSLSFFLLLSLCYSAPRYCYCYLLFKRKQCEIGLSVSLSFELFCDFVVVLFVLLTVSSNSLANAK